MRTRSPISYCLFSRVRPTLLEQQSEASMFKSPASYRKDKITVASPGDAARVGRVMEKPMVATGRREDCVPLSDVVADCVRRWFRDTLEEAKTGDSTMQVLVGQMYQNGYGVPRNEQKANAWFTKASRYRSSVWKVSEKHPGYNASDSDSDDIGMEKS